MKRPLHLHVPLSTAVYENEVPPFAEAEIERLYGSLFSTMPHFRHHGTFTATTSTYVARNGTHVEAILLFERSGAHVTVLNELIHLPQHVVRGFIDCVFAHYPSVATIALNAITADLEALPYPFQRFVCAEDIVVAPLTTVEAYTAQLSKNTRKSIRRQTNAVLREHPSYQYALVPTEAVSEELVRHIIGLNKARMADKDKISAYNDHESAWIVAMARARGMAGVVRIDGQVRAGVVFCHVADHSYLLVGAHDPAFDQFGLGTLCCYQSMCACIERGSKQVHFLWGRHTNKTSLGGMPRRFDRMTIYRSRTAYLGRVHVAARAALTGYGREARLWLVDAEAQDNLKGRIATRMWQVARRAKRSLGALTSRLHAVRPD